MAKFEGVFLYEIWGCDDVHIYAFLDTETDKRTVVTLPIEVDITGEIVLVDGKMVKHPKYGWQIKGDYIDDSQRISLQPVFDALKNGSCAPNFGKEYYDSMLEAYAHEEERVYE
jgi:hypothetical protein